MGARRRVLVEDDEEIPGPPVPPDGGWGWVVVAASFMCNVVVDGVSFSFMVFMLEFMQHFQSTAEQTAWAGSCLTGCYLLMGPITSALANRYGCRMVAIAGAIIATVAFLLSTLTTNFNWLILTYGVMGGIGFGLIYLPAIVIVGFYFEKRRALATGIAVSGSGVGIIVFPMLSSKLVKEYHWRGGLVLVAGIVLQVVICAALFRPLDAPKRKKRKPIIIYRGNIMTKLIAEKKRQRTISTHSLDNTIITKDNRLIRNKDLVQLIIAVDETVHKKPKPRPSILPVNPADISFSCTGQMNRSVAVKNRPLIEVLERDRVSNRTTGLNPGSTMSLQPHMLLCKTTEEEKEAPMTSSSGYSSTQSLPCGQPIASSETEQEIWQQHADTPANPEEEEQQREDMARPLYRRDIFFNGSVAHLPQFQAAHNDLQQYLKSVTHVPMVHHNPIFDVIREMLDLSLFKNLTFPILCLSTLLSTMGLFIPYVFVPIMAMQQEISKEEAVEFISWMGVANAIGRGLSGAVSDRPWADSLKIYGSFLVIAGVMTAVCPKLHEMLPFWSTYTQFVVYSVAFGLFTAPFVSLRSIILVDLLGLDKLTNAFGLLILLQGVAAMVGTPIAGKIYDSSGSLDDAFYAAGTLIALSGVLVLPLRIIRNWELSDKKKRGMDYMDGYDKMDKGECSGAAAPVHITIQLPKEHLKKMQGLYVPQEGEVKEVEVLLSKESVM